MALANRSWGLQDDALLNFFLSGLQVEIRRDVVAQSPLSLLPVVALAKLYEERYTPTPKSSTPLIHHYSPIPWSAHTNSSNQWRILTNIVGGAQIIHPKFIHFIIVTNTIKMNS